MARVLSVGQCGYDNSGIRRVLSSRFDVDLVEADSGDDALASLNAGAFDLVLVNRKLFSDDAPGIDVIRRIKSDPRFEALPVMMVSNFADAQAEAVQAGAEPGFGKANLNSPDTLARLANRLAPRATRTEDAAKLTR